MGARLRPGALLLIAGLAVVAAGCGSKQAAKTTSTAPAQTQAQPAKCPPASGTGAVLALPQLHVVNEWRLDSPNTTNAYGCITYDGKPVSGVRVAVEQYELPARTDAKGGFSYPVDTTVPTRYRVHVTGVSAAEVGGAAATPAQKEALRATESSLSVYFKLGNVKTTKRSDGAIVVSGRATFENGEPPPPVVLYSYRLSGRLLDANGKPVAGATVSTRSVDREVWTISRESDRTGHYNSIFYPTGDADPVGFLIRVAVGDTVYDFRNNELAFFAKLKSAELDLQLPKHGLHMDVSEPRAYPGAVYEGVLIGVADSGKPVHPVAATWADEQGNFRFVLPKSSAGKHVAFWESQLYAFSRTPAKPGAPVDLANYPAVLLHDMPQDLLRVQLPQ
jgi:hypothetical protein